MVNLLQKPIGGFFELEQPLRDAPYHEAALSLANGRVCFKVALLIEKPSRVYVPFYCCDALLEPLEELQIPYSFYFLNAHLEPALDFDLKPNEMMVKINHFGLQKCSDTEGVVFDNTQAFFHKPIGNKSWYFNSARKFFGVPDGGFLYAPAAHDFSFYKNLPQNNPQTAHLDLRKAGKQAEAYTAFQENEATQNTDLAAMSLFSQKILTTGRNENADNSAENSYAKVAEIRRKNYQILHEELGKNNTFSPDFLHLDAAAVPFCYPLLLDFAVDKTVFFRQNIFIPTLWADVLKRKTPPQYLEEKLVKNLLPLPLDHRMEASDLERLTDAIKQII